MSEAMVVSHVIDGGVKAYAPDEIPSETLEIFIKRYWFIPGVFVFLYHHWERHIIQVLEKPAPVGLPVTMIYETTF